MSDGQSSSSIHEFEHDGSVRDEIDRNANDASGRSRDDDSGNVNAILEQLGETSLKMEDKPTVPTSGPGLLRESHENAAKTAQVAETRSARGDVLNTTELLQMILERVDDMGTLLHAQRVNRKFRDVISEHRTPGLRRALWLEPDPAFKDEVELDQTFVNPLIFNNRHKLGIHEMISYHASDPRQPTSFWWDHWHRAYRKQSYEFCEPWDRRLKLVPEAQCDFSNPKQRSNKMFYHYNVEVRFRDFYRMGELPFTLPGLWKEMLLYQPNAFVLWPVSIGWLTAKGIAGCSERLLWPESPTVEQIMRRVFNVTGDPQTGSDLENFR